MAQNLVNSLVVELVVDFGGGLSQTVGQPYLTSDGYVLITADDDVLINRNFRKLTALKQSQPLLTSDGFVLTDNNNQILLG